MLTRSRCILLAVQLFLLSAGSSFAGTRMIFPRVIFQKGRFLGIAIANPNSSSASITLTAYNSDGTPYSGTGVTNPVTPDPIPSGGQYLKLAYQIFNPPSSVIFGDNPTLVWVEVTSTTDGLTGFFLEGDDQQHFMDGADLTGSGTDLVIPVVENTGSSTTELSIVNPGSQPANVTVSLYKSDGTVTALPSKAVPKLGALMGPLSNLFSADYGSVVSLRIQSDAPVVGLANIFRNNYNSLVTVAAQDATAPAKTLYFPQLAQGDAWFTNVGVSNLDLTQPILVTITAFQEDGSLFALPGMTNPVTATIQPGGVLRAGLKDLMGFPASPLQTGWIEVDASSTAINGFVEYGSGTDLALVAAQLHPSQIYNFSHQAMQPPYYTGLAVLNPGSLSANLEVYSLKPDGTSIGKTQRVLRPGQKLALLIQQWVPAAAGQTGGSVFVRADKPVVATQLYGTDAPLTALANVPPQTVATGFSPSPTQKIATVPPLAVVETGKTQSFTVSGGTGLSWSVNGVAGGSDSLGSISGAGVYKAPSKTPSPHSLTIQASSASGDLSGGSSIDVVQREALTGGLTLVTSVAYLEAQQRFFIAEQQILSSAPSGRENATTNNARVSLVDPVTKNPSPVITIPGDTISKMLPFVDGSTSYLLLAGVDKGIIYRLNVSVTPAQLATVITGLNKPNSMDIDPVSGNLLVLESGATPAQITQVPRAKILSASAPQKLQAGSLGPQRLNALQLPGLPQGLWVYNCTGAIYVTNADGTVYEYSSGGAGKLIASGLNNPGQLLTLYREGMPCADGLALAIVEATQITLIYPKANASPPYPALVTGLQNPRDIAYFPKGNPYIPGGEASIGISEAPSGPSQSTISAIPVGGLFQATAPQTAAKLDSTGAGVVPFTDPAGDTFATAASAGLPVPDIISVNSQSIGGSSVITVRLLQPVDSITGVIFMSTKEGSAAWQAILAQLAQYFPLGFPNLPFDTFIDLSSGAFYSITQTQQLSVGVSVLGTIVNISMPDSLVSLKDASMMILIGNKAEITDVAPNGGFLNLSP